MANDEEINKDDIESILYHGVANGDLDLKGLKNGESTFGITRQGEEKVEEMAGGKDVLGATSVFLKLLCKHGAMGFDIENNITNFTLIAKLLHTFKHYGDWDSLMKAAKGKI